MDDMEIAKAFAPWVQQLFLAVLPVLGAWAVAELRRRSVNATLVAAIERAGGEAYRHLLASGRAPTDPGALAAAARAGSLYLFERVPDALRARGVSAEAAEQIAGAELGRLLATDPSVRVGPG
jgi:hypothetical protein